MTRRLLLSYLTVTLVVLVLLELPLAVFYRQREVDRLTVDAERDATVLATIYEDALEKGLEPDPVPADDYQANTAARVVVVDTDGISIVDSGNDINRDFSTRPEIATALSGQRSTGTRRSDTLDTDLLYVAVPVASGGTVHGALRLTLDTHEVTERVRNFWLALVAIGVIILVVMAGIGFAIARSVTMPVRRLQAAADRFSGGDLTPDEIDSTAPAELAALQKAMNDMARQLDQLIVQQKAFVADASHQLRTPLTALRLRLENLESAASPELAGDVTEILDETDRLGALVDDLLLLAKSEQSSELVIVDLTATVRDRVDTWSATAELNDVELTLSVPSEEVRVSAVPGGIEQVLDNLIDNAIRASSEGSVVAVTVVIGEESHRVTIADHGSGIHDDDKSAALTRFWRADTSTAGTGLGLAIARNIVETSGGALTLSDNDPSGLVVTFTLRCPTSVATPARPARGGASA